MLVESGSSLQPGLLWLRTLTDRLPGDVDQIQNLTFSPARLTGMLFIDCPWVRDWYCRLSVAQQELVIYTEKMTKQAQQISDYEYEISLLRKQLEGLETEHEKDQQKIADLEELLKKARDVSTSYCFWMLSCCRASWMSSLSCMAISSEILHSETYSSWRCSD